MEAVLKKAITTSLILVLLTGIGACTIITGEHDSPILDGDSTPLSLMLHAVPPTGTTTLIYNNIPALSEYHGREIPLRTVSIEDKVEWWMSFQDTILWGYPAPIITELWGFDATDVSGVLTFWGEGPVTILCGDIDTTTFRQKLLSYGYTETTYLDFTVFTGMHEDREYINVDVQLHFSNIISGLRQGEFNIGILPRVFGVIPGAGTEEEPVNLIVMSEGGDGDIEFATKNIEASLAAYRQKSSLADEDNPLTVLASSVGEVGAAYITTDTRLNMVLQVSKGHLEERMRAAVGPGELSPYDAAAMTYRWEDESIVFEFILAYETPAAAQANIPVLQERLSQGRSFWFKDALLSEIWTIEEVVTNGSFLQATVRLVDNTKLYDVFFSAMVWMGDYWFLYTGE